MIIRKILFKYFFVTLIIFIFIPTFTKAYFTTEQNAYVLDENNVLFSIKYVFGTENYDVLMPIGARRSYLYNEEKTNVGYNVLEDGEITPIGKTYAVVLSNANVKDNNYFVPITKANEFNLIVLLTLPDGVTVDQFKPAVQVTSLPFKLIERNGNIQSNHLNEPELRPYRTP